MNLCASTAQRGALSPWFLPFYPLQTGERESWEIHTTHKAEFFTHQPNAWSDITLIMCTCLSLEAFQWWAGNEYLIIWCKNEVRNAFKIVIQRVLYWENEVGEQWSQKSKSIVAIPCYYCTLVQSHSCKGLNNSGATWVILITATVPIIAQTLSSKSIKFLQGLANQLLAEVNGKTAIDCGFCWYRFGINPNYLWLSANSYQVLARCSGTFYSEWWGKMKAWDMRNSSHLSYHLCLRI